MLYSHNHLSKLSKADIKCDNKKQQLLENGTLELADTFKLFCNSSWAWNKAKDNESISFLVNMKVKKVRKSQLIGNKNNQSAHKLIQLCI